MISHRCRFNHWLPRLISKFFPIEAITIYPWILCTGSSIDASTLRHELHHIKQIQYYGVVKFYISYLWYYLCLRRRWCHSSAYLLIPYEMDARRVESGLQPWDVNLR